MRKLFLYFALILGLVVLVFLVTLWNQKGQEAPPAMEGPEAEALMERILTATGDAAWSRARAASYSMEPGNGHYFTDFSRGLGEIRFEESGKKVVVRFSHDGRLCEAYVDEKIEEADAAEERCQSARKEEKRARFWLHPFGKIAKEAKHGFVGARALLATFPDLDNRKGDRYLIVTDEKGLPTHWKTWSESLPVGGLEVSFEEWKDLSRGARVSTFHRTFLNEIRMSDIELYYDSPRNPEEDRFQTLVGSRE